MNVTGQVDRLRADLAAAAAAGTDETRRVATLLATALEPAVRLALLEMLSDAAAEVTAALDGPTVDVRMHGSEPRIVVTTPPEGPEPPAVATADDAEGTARLTLRMPESVKARLEETAARDGLSVNTWLVRAVVRALDTLPNPRGGRRITGYARG